MCADETWIGENVLENEEITGVIIGSASKVHEILGYGVLKEAYEKPIGASVVLVIHFEKAR